MSKRDFYLLLDELLENAPGTIQGNEVLSSIPKWDSLALIGFIALLDQHFDLTVPAAKINECKTVADLVSLLGPRLN